MFDAHFDLLTKVYMCKLENNYDFIINWIKNYNKDNVTGLIANMCFMSKSEMQEEYNKNYYDENISVYEMFKQTIDILEEYLPGDINCLYGIEGCTYIKDLDELEKLYSIGLKSVCIVWNEPNKYASGIRGEYGLTDKGINFIEKCINLGIAIDLSHANENTFNDIIDIVKANSFKKPIIFASHSNSRKFCDKPRNLSDEQLYKLKSVGGYVGVMSNRNFVNLHAIDNDISKKIIREEYITHIKHIGRIIGYDHVLLSTDDMTFSYGNPRYKLTPIYNYNNIKYLVQQDLEKYFSKEIVNGILCDNAKKLFNLDK